MAGRLKVQWWKEAERSIQGVYGYLLNEWGEREASSFLDLLERFEKKSGKISQYASAVK